MAVVAFLVPWLALVLTACALSAAVGWWATRRAAAAARRALEAHARDGDAVVLRGRLRIEGNGAESDWGGDQKLAALSPIHSRSRLWPRQARIVDRGERCAKLWLDTAEGGVRLEGPLGVEAGSRQRHKGYSTRDDHGKWFNAEYALFEGDEVVAAGVREGSPLSGTSAEGRYRDSATHETLSPLDNGSILLATAHARWAPAPRQLLRLPVVVLVGLIALVPACSSSTHYADTAERCADTCLERGACAVGLKPWKRLGDGLESALRGDVYTCVASDDASCRRSELCQSIGACSENDGHCAPLTDDDCRYTAGCLKWGQCGAVAGACRVASDAHCIGLATCSDHGRCHAINGSCSAGSDEACAASYYCHSLGHCSKVGDECKAGSDEDCAASDQCHSLGHCSARDGGCTVATSSDCRRTYACSGDGKCTFVEGEGCAVTSDDDCVFSEACSKSTRCRFETGQCVSDGTCATSAACRVHGHCDGEGYCSARTDADCEPSEACKQRGACRALAGTCAESCKAEDACKKYGRCSDFGLQGCGAAGDDCRQAEVCRTEGKCSAVQGECVARSHDDCKQALICQWEGRCTQLGNACVADGDDCLSTRNCRSIGYCEAREGHCQEGRGDDHCATSPLCSLLGRCAWGGYECVSGSDEHCRRSEVCSRNGFCEQVDAGCFVRGAH